MGSKYAQMIFRKRNAFSWLASRKIPPVTTAGFVLVGNREIRDFHQFSAPSVNPNGIRPNSFLGVRWLDNLRRCRWKSDATTTTTSAAGDKPLGGVLFNEKLTGTVLSEEERAKATIAEIEAESEEEKKKRESSWRMMKYSFIFFGVTVGGSLMYIVFDWGSPKRDENGNPIVDEFSALPDPQQHLYRAWNEMKSYNKMIKDPSRAKLLPDPLTEPYYQPPLTLVLEMTDVLVHPDWTYQTGWRFKKRPGVDFFLQQVGPPLYEVVIYTSEQGFTAFPILDTLDPNGYIMYRLFRDATRYVDGVHMKDLNCLNRDLSKVIMVDWNSKATTLNPQNTLLMKKWDGSDEDRTLVDLAIMLRTIATSGVKDVRDVIQYYMSFPDPIEAFRENQRRLQEELEMEKQMQSQEKQAPLAKQWMPSFLGKRKL